MVGAPATGLAPILALVKARHSSRRPHASTGPPQYPEPRHLGGYALLPRRMKRPPARGAARRLFAAKPQTRQMRPLLVCSWLRATAQTDLANTLSCRRSIVCAVPIRGRDWSDSGRGRLWRRSWSSTSRAARSLGRRYGDVDDARTRRLAKTTVTTLTRATTISQPAASTSSKERDRASTGARAVPATTVPDALPLLHDCTTLASRTPAIGCQVTRCSPCSTAASRTPDGTRGGAPVTVTLDAST